MVHAQRRTPKRRRPPVRLGEYRRLAQLRIYLRYSARCRSIRSWRLPNLHDPSPQWHLALDRVRELLSFGPSVGIYEHDRRTAAVDCVGELDGRRARDVEYV